MNRKFLEESLLKMQQDLFNAIKKNGEKGKESLIRSSQFIDQIHQTTKKSFLMQNKKLFIKPEFNKTNPEENIQGLIKFKNQDITIRIKDSQYTLPLVVNVRSQMSSIEKNFDTILERAFAEVVNLRLAKNYIIGEVFLLPFQELDQDACKKNKVNFFSKTLNFEKFFLRYNLINHRKNYDEDKNNFYKCDKICLLVVDFKSTPPKLVTDFGSDKLNKAYKELSYEGFCKYLLNKYEKSISAE
jgi:hypothetical protein